MPRQLGLFSPTEIRRLTSSFFHRLNDSRFNFSQNEPVGLTRLTIIKCYTYTKIYHSRKSVKDTTLSQTSRRIASSLLDSFSRSSAVVKRCEAVEKQLYCTEVNLLQSICFREWCVLTSFSKINSYDYVIGIV